LELVELSLWIGGRRDRKMSVSVRLFTFTTSNLTVKPNPLKPSGHYMYHHFNVQQFYVLPTQCIYVFCVDLRTNSDYFHIQH